jgi:phosphoribosylformylglycinamidine cyclo-ligase
MSMQYRDAGVDIEAGDDLVRRIRPFAARTHRKEVVSGVGGFAALCALPSGMKDPLLVSGTDGVGTKLKIAFATGVHDTIGIDLVAMCVNDVITTGAEPLFFLDYFATGRLDVAVAEAVVRGISAGCEQAGCALIGGETAELPGMYADGEYDLAGFAVGVVERAAVLDGARARPGDVLVALGSSGLHSNGFSLVRRVLLERLGLSFDDRFDDGATLGATLLTPTRIYARSVAALTRSCGDGLRSLAHITGGGLTENVPRALPDQLAARLDLASYERPALFRKLAAEGPIDEDEMRRTFNLGVGLVAVVAPDAVDVAQATLAPLGEHAWVIGDVVTRDNGPRVRYEA